ncbi:MAG: hypothetical protein BWX83_00785 [Candidatus Cloacimonetes bacterium ADurb.Bin117]|nr:MAG: hypothetical protein BWX83_00785 [Candidatus Cloacimonetes bacterium ADurb.Bin117]
MSRNPAAQRLEPLETSNINVRVAKQIACAARTFM